MEPKGEDRLRSNDALARKVAALASQFDPVPKSVVDEARAAFSADARADRARDPSDTTNDKRDS